MLLLIVILELLRRKLIFLINKITTLEIFIHLVVESWFLIYHGRVATCCEAAKVAYQSVVKSADGLQVSGGGACLDSSRSVLLEEVQLRSLERVFLELPFFSLCWRLVTDAAEVSCRDISVTSIFTLALERLGGAELLLKWVLIWCVILFWW